MSALLDPLAVARDLEAAGVERGQAEAMVEAFGKAAAATPDRDDLATADDLKAVKDDVKVLADGLKAVESALRTEIAALETRTLERVQTTERRTIAAGFAAVGLLFALLKFVPGGV